MSSVGSSDSSNRQQDEAVRRNREDYRQNESDMVKKHQKELRRISEQHFAEIERLKSDHANQMEALHKASKDAISERDFRYQQDMDDVRSMYKKQLKTNADEAQKRDDLTKKTTNESESLRQRNNDERFDKLNRDYADAIRAKEKLYNDSLKENAEAQARALDEGRNQIENYHKREMSSVKNERDKSVNELQKQYVDYRENSEGRMKSQEVKHMQDNQRASNDLVRAVQKERALRVESEGILRDGFKDGLNDTRDRFEKAMSKEREANRMSSEELKSSAGDRIDNQVRRLEYEKEDLKEGKVRNELQLKQKQDRELNNMRKAFQNNVENLQEQRDEAVRQSNVRNRDDVQSIRKDMSKQLVDTNRFYRERMEENNRISREAYENIKGDFSARNEQSKSTADQRVQKIYQDSETEKGRMIERQADEHVAFQTMKRNELKEQRDNMDFEKNQVVRNMQDQMRKQELQHSEKMSAAVNKYEKQITSLKDQIFKERKQAEENLKRTVEGMQRAHKMALDQVDARNRDQLRQTSAVHNDELRSLNKRHEDKLDQVLTEVKKG